MPLLRQACALTRWRSLLILLLLISLVFIVVGYPTLVSLLTASAETGFSDLFLPSELEERRIIQEARLHVMHQRCLELNDSWKEANWQGISANRQKRVVMCLVAKAACTTWMRLLLQLTGNPDAVKLTSGDRHQMHTSAVAFLVRFDRISTSMRHHYLTGDYYKAMFVREPLERLISAYRDKMLRATDYYLTVRSEVKRMFRPNVSVSSPEFARNVTFAEFVRYVLWEREHRAPVDVHWRPQYDVCRPCHIKYDYLGYYETMHNDAKDVLRKIAAGSGVEFPLGDIDNPLPHSNKYLELFQNVTVSDLRRIIDFYANDYKVFGYKIPDAILHKLGDEKS